MGRPCLRGIRIMPLGRGGSCQGLRLWRNVLVAFNLCSDDGMRDQSAFGWRNTATRVLLMLEFGATPNMVVNSKEAKIRQPPSLNVASNHHSNQ